MASRHDRDNENTPLLEAQQERTSIDINSGRQARLSGSSKGDHFFDDPFNKTKGTLYLILLTLPIGGLQLIWSLEFSNGSPYLLSLGMSKVLVAFVWLAAPVTGVFVQPYIGMVSDRSRISWGKRKPFMIAGTLGTAICSLLLAYAKQIIQFLGGWGPDAVYEGQWQGFTIAFAAIMMWVLDFSVNTVQAANRAFIVDGAPSHQQEAANAWASRMTGIGNIIGYLAAYLDLPQYLSFLGTEQFQILCTFASICFLTTIIIAVSTIKERNPQDEPATSEVGRLGIFAFFKQVWQSIKRLPKPIRTVCEIQFCAWLGWFPFLFYITTYIGQLYVNPRLSPDLSPGEVNKLWARATRVGSFALVIEAIVSLSVNLLLPIIVEPTYKAEDDAVLKPSFRQRIARRLQIPGFTIRRAWLLSELLFFACMVSTFFISTPSTATVMVGFVGVAWSLSLWAPYSLISAEISKRDEARRARYRRKLRNGDDNPFSDDEETHEEDRAGIILGLHNVAVSGPQILATLISSVIFKFLQKPRNVPGDVSVAWTLRLGGLAFLPAAYLTYKMRESVAEDEES